MTTHVHNGLYRQLFHYENVGGLGEFGGHPLLEDIQEDEDRRGGNEVV